MDTNIANRVLSTFSDTLRDKYLNKHFNRYKTMGRARSFNLYNHVFDGEKIVSTRKRVDLSKFKLKDVFSRNRSSRITFDNELPLPINSKSRIVGVLKGKNPYFNLSKEFEPNYTALRCLQKAYGKFNEFTSKNFIKVLPGTWEFSSKNLRQMATLNEREYSIDELMSGLRSRKDIEFVLPYVGQYEVDSINNVRVNHKSFTGVRTSRLFGRKRLNSTRFTKPMAHQYVRDIIMAPRKHYVLDTSLYYVGGREKRVIVPYGTTKNDIGTRCVLAQEDVSTIIGQSVVVKINESLQRLAEGFNWGGRINGRGKFLELLNNLDCKADASMTNANTDFSGHDNRVNENEIVVAMAWLRNCFDECPKIDRLFMYLLSSLVFKRVVLPESKLIYEFERGLPTGHSFTSILTTMTAYMKQATAIEKVCTHDELQKTYLQGAGDDWINKLPIAKLKAISDEINLNSGAICDDFSINSNDMRTLDDDRRPTFLKKAYISGGIAWNKLELFINYSFPTSKYRSIANYRENATVMCTSGPLNFELNKIMKNLNIVMYYEKTITKYWSRLHNYNYFINNRLKWIDRNVNKLIDSFGINFMGDVDLNNKLFMPLTLFEPISKQQIHTIDMRSHIDFFIKDFDERIRRSCVYMLSSRKFERFETLVRLRVFDTKKKYIQNEPNIMLNKSIFHYIYLRSNRL